MQLISIDRFFNIVLSFYWLWPVLITFLILFCFFSFFQVIKNYQKHTSSKIIVDLANKITFLKLKKTKVNTASRLVNSPEKDDKQKVFVAQRHIETKQLFNRSSSLSEIAQNITKKSLDKQISSIEKDDKIPDAKKTMHTESFKVSAPRRKYSK